MAWDGDVYQRTYDERAAAGQDVHGEANFVEVFHPRTVLDAGCGTGRVGAELSRRGVDVVGVDMDSSMLSTARSRAPEVTWVLSDLTLLNLERTFDVVLMAGNVPLFTPPGTEAALVAGVARHVAPGGLLIAGFSLGGSYSLEHYDADAAAVGLTLVERWATWDRDPFSSGDYAVSVHRTTEILGKEDS